MLTFDLDVCRLVFGCFAFLLSLGCCIFVLLNLFGVLCIVAVLWLLIDGFEFVETLVLLVSGFRCVLV